MMSPNRPADQALLLALDTGSPSPSLAIGRQGETLAERSFSQSSTSARLLVGVVDVLAEIGAEIEELGGLVVLAGPGSFTGLRVGLASALGLHQALSLPALALPTFEALAEAGSEKAAGRSLLAVVDALRGEWFAQRFVFEAGSPRPVTEPGLQARDQVWAQAPALVVGFGAKAALGGEGAPVELEWLEPLTLARFALRVAARWQGAWDPAGLVEPLYLRPPAVTLPPPKPAR